MFFYAAATTGPLCDRHHVPMALAAYEDNGIALAGYAYLCWEAGCRRFYEPTIGYFDVLNGMKITVPGHVTCPSHGLPMYEGHFDFLVQSAQLRCPQAYCPQKLIGLQPV